MAQPSPSKPRGGTARGACLLVQAKVKSQKAKERTLDGEMKSKRYRKKQVRITRGSHTDTVIGLSWHKVHRQVLASSSGDNTLKVWNVTTHQCSSTRTSKAQSVRWNGTEVSILASAGHGSSWTHAPLRRCRVCHCRRILNAWDGTPTDPLSSSQARRTAC